LVTALTVLAFVTTARMQAQEDSIALDVTAGDRAAATYSASNFRYHLAAANTPAGRTAMAAHSLGTPFVPVKKSPAHPAPIAAATTIPAVPSPGFYPEDLVFLGGKFLATAKSHPVFVNTASCGTVATCWGDPATFLTNLSNSMFIHLTDQYVGTTTNNRYPVSTSVSATVALFGSNVVGQDDILAVVHAAAKSQGTGYGHIYHVFLPSGVDTCFDLTSTCYSPDNPATFAFCAYHGSVTFGDIGHVLLSVEPFQNVPGCQAAPPNPNSLLIDSTNSVLSHELIEAITDPDPPTGWVSDSSAVTAGFEIGDLCQGLSNVNGQAIIPTLNLNGKNYELQLEYGNKYHACTPAP
jgi:hypothetical protein